MIFRKNFYIKILVVLLLLAGFIFYNENPVVLKLRFKIINFFAPAYRINWKFWQSDQAVLLKEKEQMIKSLEFELEDLRKENSSLKESLNFKTRSKFSSLKSSRVIFYARDLGRDFLIIDIRKEDGAGIGNIVIDNKGVLVGVIQETNDRFSKVDMAYNQGRSFEAEIKELNMRVLAEGVGSGEWYLKLIPAGSQLKNGEKISLIGGQFKSILLGEVSEAGSENIFAESKARALFYPEYLDNVFVIVN